MPAASGAPTDDPFAHTRMSLGEHLNELRKRLFRGALALAVAFSVCLAFNEQIIEAVREPFSETVARLNAYNVEKYTAEVEARPDDAELRARFFEPDGTFRFLIDERLVASSPTEGMWFLFKIAGYGALVFGGPILLWELWQFIAAGLYPRERRWIWYFFPPALALFVIGVLFSYFVIVPYGMFYAQQMISIEYFKPLFTIGSYFDFLIMMCLSMGLVFQLPILMTFLGLVDIVPAKTFASMRGYFVIAAFAIAALLSPGTDIFSQIAMAVPMIVLYEVGILGARFAGRRHAPAAS